MTTVINGTSTSASAPAVVGDDGDTGVYFPSANTLALSAGGTQVSTINAYGIGLGAGTTPSSGMGITFPASQNASSNANTLDDYEEGSWTPTVGGTATYIANSGDYTKIGNFVYIRCILNINVLGTGSTSYITGLPFAPDTKNSYRNGIMFSYWSALNNSYVFLGGNIEGGQISFIGTTAASTGVTDGTALFKNGAYVIFSGCYQTA